MILNTTSIEMPTENTGNAGDLFVEATNISLLNGSTIILKTRGDGKGGMATLKAQDSVTLEGKSIAGFPNSIQLETGQYSGNAGNLLIEANDISFLDGAYITSSTYGQGPGGTAELKAKDSVLFQGENSKGYASAIKVASISENYGAGEAGNILIEAKNISFLDGAWLDSSSEGMGNGGTITLKAEDTVLFRGERRNGYGSFMQSSSRFKKEHAGDGGSLLIEADNIFFMENTYIQSSSQGPGNGGHVTLKAKKDVIFDGKMSTGNSGRQILLTSYGNNGIGDAGNAGNLSIEAAFISFLNGFSIISNTFGKGNAGFITLKANHSVTFSGESNDDQTAHIGLSTYSQEAEAGKAGELFIEADDILFTNGAYIQSSTSGTGDAGMIDIHAKNQIILSDTRENTSQKNVSRIEAIADINSLGGLGGEIFIHADALIMRDGCYISTSTESSGNAGSIHLDVGNLELFSGASINSKTENKRGGNAGSIIINASDFITLIGEETRISTSSHSIGKGGNISITTHKISLVSSTISSDTLMINNQKINDISERHNIYLITGDIVETLDTPQKYILIQNKFHPLINQRYTFSSQTEMLQFLYPMTGDIAEIAVSGTESETYIAVPSIDSNQNPVMEWIQFDQNKVVHTYDSINEFYATQLSHASGDVLQVNMPEIEKSVCFVYHNGVDASSGQTFPNPVWLNQFEIENRDALNTLSNQYLLDNNTIATIPETDLKFKYHDGEWIQIKSNCNVESLLEAENITAQPGNCVTIKIPGNSNSETLIYSGKDFIKLNHSYTAADLNERNSLIVESGDVVHVMNNGENNRQSYLYAEDDWIPFHSGGDSGMINISAQQINITDHGKITTSSENEGNAGNVNIEMSDFLLDNGSEITSESTSGIFGGSAGSINIGGEIVSNDGYYHIVRQGNSVRLKNNSRISTDAVSAGGGKINIQAKDSIYATNSTISTNVKDGTGKGGDINIDPEFVILNHSNISANAIEGDGGAIFIVADHFIKSSDSVIEATSERGNDGTVKIDAPDVDISSGLIKLSSEFLDASQWLRSACGQRSSENISRLIVRGKDAVPVKPDDLHSSPVIVFKDLHLKQSDIKNDIIKAEVCYQRGDFESAARIWFDAEKRLKKNSKDYLTTMPSYFLQNLTKQH
jgi:large exoprotein involved in heme utilization and adhesion